MKSVSSHKTESQLFNTYSSWESSLDNNSSHGPFENDWLYNALLQGLTVTHLLSCFLKA